MFRPSRPAIGRSHSYLIVTAAVALVGCARTQGRQRYASLLQESSRASAPGATARFDPTVPTHALEAEGADPLGFGASLQRGALLQAVLRRNPDVEWARQGFRAALAEYPQAVAFEDPMLAYSLAPLSLDPSMRFGQSVELSQKLPWPGKLALAGEVALAEAEAAKIELDAVRLQLALAASLLFDRYYLVARSRELNDDHRELLEAIRQAVMARFEAGAASQRELLQIELELAHVAHDEVVLQSRRDVVVAQINGLLHRPSEAPLPPPPAELTVELDDLAPTEVLQTLALEARPELKSKLALIEARDRGIRLSERQFYPDFMLMTSYNAMWADWQHQWMLGVSLNLPLQIRARRAAVEQARARRRQSELELASATDDVLVEVSTTRLQALEAHHVLEVYRARLLPAARAQIEAARLDYQSGRGSFQGLIDAERSLRRVELQYQEALATFSERRAELANAVGVLAISEPGGGR